MMSCTPASSADHPRSRGVYLSSRCVLDTTGGSSPLARGLLTQYAKLNPRKRIIPARAGFTASHQRTSGSRSDHPRSRGVYALGEADGDGAVGSSPLARGLQIFHHRLDMLDRIIPARAGFTCRSSASHLPHRDHPRSRGVYRDGQWEDGEPLGSSPLARGLHAAVYRQACDYRIIPARAGFTGVMVRLIAECPDHPRSRGVYGPRVLPWDGYGGSSPLARGLRRREDSVGQQRGIIPARAGFTLSRRTGM